MVISPTCLRSLTLMLGFWTLGVAFAKGESALPIVDLGYAVHRATLNVRFPTNGQF